MVYALRHTGIVVKNMKKALSFYRDLLGLRMVAAAEESGPFIDAILALKHAQVDTIKLTDGNGCLLELLRFRPHSSKKSRAPAVNEPGITHIALTVNNLDSTYKKLLKKGIRFTTPPLVSPSGKANVTFCRDYEGNYIELVQDLSRNSRTHE